MMHFFLGYEFQLVHGFFYVNRRLLEETALLCPRVMPRVTLLLPLFFHGNTVRLEGLVDLIDCADAVLALFYGGEALVMRR